MNEYHKLSEFEGLGDQLDTRSKADKIFDDLLSWAHQGIVKVKFEKLNGRKRILWGTLMPEFYANYDFVGANKSHSPNLTPIWDIEEDAWRYIRRGSIDYVEFHDKSEFFG